ncbi:protein of unknown function [Gillisia sp. Hel1_33_143]|uniref:DUF4270 domain-containing protein n=1 Tax=Gillisia sp. Hel1_33_143 TaxID=1336796 RepID=UPI00087DEB05|nr:DUF4270 domain-containing protein [Gillisia sp. Hel1_33_143]SDR92931.1 protein of unknown function [Gillisia sp. Hel1_33_143]
MILLKRLRFMPLMLLTVLAFISCDEDYNTIGGDLIGGQLDSLPRYNPGVIAYSKKLGPVQTNNLPVNLLGVYKDPVFGLQSANVLTQISLATLNPNFGTEPVLDSVILTLPYFSTQIDTDEDGGAVYQLDSIYGTSPVKLTVRRSNYFLNDFDPTDNFQNRQKYFSNQADVFSSSLIGDPLYSNDSFRPTNNRVSYAEVNSSTGNLDTVQKSPRLRVALDKDFFQQNIIDKQGSPELFNNNNFKNYFRGLYFSAEAVNGDGTLMLLNFANSDANIKLYYRSKVADTNDSNEDGDTTDLIYSPASFTLDFNANRVNTLSQDFPAEFLQLIEGSSEDLGSKNLVLKGGAGSMAVIELFEDEEEIQLIRDNNWLINEASLEFYVDQSKITGGDVEPERIYVYDIENNIFLLDYQIDLTLDADRPLNSGTTFASRLVRDEDGNGVKYKIRITELVKSILDENSDVRKLGVVVTQNINLTSNASLKNSIALSDDDISTDLVIDRIPTGSVISPKGTVLYGNLADDEDKRLKFNIYYTETNN